MAKALIRRVAVATWPALAACESPEDLQALVPPTADQDPNLPQVSVAVAGESVALHLETWGDPSSPVLFVMHGSLSDFRALRAFSPLADDYFVVFWDQRGNGLSQRIDRDAITEAAIVEEIGVLKQMYAPDRRITLIGHSFGAMYAALYMSRRPDDVEQAVLIEPAGLNSAIFEATFDDVFDLKIFDHGWNASVWETEIFGPRDHEEMDYESLALLQNGQLLQYYCDADDPPPWPVWRPGAYFDYWRNKGLRAGGGFSFDYATGLESFPREVLLVGSECSALGTAFQEQHHRPLFADARVVGIPGVGHRMVVEAPAAVLAAVRAYLTP
jgi:proline iminopeptidase